LEGLENEVEKEGAENEVENKGSEGVEKDVANVVEKGEAEEKACEEAKEFWKYGE
jgi:hypothetical protein